MSEGASIILTLSERGSHVDVGSFATAARALRVILREVGSAVSGKPGGDMRWGVRALRSAGGTLEAVAVAQDGAAEQATQVVSACVDGLDQLERSARRPDFFTERALAEVRTLVRLLEADVGRITVSGAERRAVITRQLAAHLDEVLAPVYSAPSSVEGWVETVSVEAPPVFGLRERLDGHYVECHFPREMLEKVRQALGRRVLVVGNVSFGRRDRPQRVQVERIRVFPPEEELPPTEALRGLDPDFTGGKDSTEYVRGLYDG